MTPIQVVSILHITKKYIGDWPGFSNQMQYHAIISLFLGVHKSIVSPQVGYIKPYEDVVTDNKVGYIKPYEDVVTDNKVGYIKPYEDVVTDNKVGCIKPYEDVVTDNKVGYITAIQSVVSARCASLRIRVI